MTPLPQWFAATCSHVLCYIIILIVFGELSWTLPYVPFHSKTQAKKVPHLAHAVFMIEDGNVKMHEPDFKGQPPHFLVIHWPVIWRSSELMRSDLTLCPWRSLIMTTWD